MAKTFGAILKSEAEVSPSTCAGLRDMTEGCHLVIVSIFRVLPQGWSALYV